MLNIPFDVIDCEPVSVCSKVASEIAVVEVSFSESVVGLASVSEKYIAILENVLLDVWQLNFVVAETVVTGVVVTEAVLDVVVKRVVELVVIVFTVSTRSTRYRRWDFSSKSSCCFNLHTYCKYYE